jgi:hypothetical protein
MALAWSGIREGSDRAVTKVFGPAVFEVAEDVDRRVQLRRRFLGTRQSFRLRRIECDEPLAEFLAFFGQRYLYRSLVVVRPFLDDVIGLYQLFDT